jgi:hypothetical protein
MTTSATTFTCSSQSPSSSSSAETSSSLTSSVPLSKRGRFISLWTVNVVDDESQAAYVANFDWEAGNGLICLFIATFIKAVDIVVNVLVPTPTIMHATARGRANTRPSEARSKRPLYHLDTMEIERMRMYNENEFRCEGETFCIGDWSQSADTAIVRKLLVLQ